MRDLDRLNEVIDLNFNVTDTSKKVTETKLPCHMTRGLLIFLHIRKLIDRILSLSFTNCRETFVNTFMLQIAVLSNHLNGRDTHVRQIKVYGPRPCVSLYS